MTHQHKLDKALVLCQVCETESSEYTTSEIRPPARLPNRRTCQSDGSRGRGTNLKSGVLVPRSGGPLRCLRMPWRTGRSSPRGSRLKAELRTPGNKADKALARPDKTKNCPHLQGHKMLCPALISELPQLYWATPDPHWLSTNETKCSG